MPPGEKETVKLRPLTFVLIGLGFVFVAIGVYYLVTPAHSLAAFVPGHQAGSTHHPTKHGLAMFALAVVCWVGAWFTTAPAKIPAAVPALVQGAYPWR
jgi:hypothetical protein